MPRRISEQEKKRTLRDELEEKIDSLALGDDLDEKKEELEHMRKLKKPIKKPEDYTHFKDTTFPVKNYNFQADLLAFNKFAVTDEGYGYLLTIIYIYNGKVDFEPIKRKNAEQTLAIKRIFRRGILQKPKKTFSTDAGKEFANNELGDYLKEENIYHKIARAKRHSQQAKIEGFNRTIKSYLMRYLEAKTNELPPGRYYKNWTDILPLLRVYLNNIVGDVPDQDPYTYPFKKLNLIELKQKNKLEPKFRVGDMVHVNLEMPITFRGNPRKQPDFRTGDYRFELEPRRIRKVINFFRI